MNVLPGRIPTRRLAADVGHVQVEPAGLELRLELPFRLLGEGGTRRQAEVEHGQPQTVLPAHAVGRDLLLLEPVVQRLHQPQALDLRRADVVALVPANPRDLAVLVVFAVVLHHGEVELVVVVDPHLEARVGAEAVAVVGRELRLRVGQGVGDLDAADGVLAPPLVLVVVTLRRGAREVDADREAEVLVRAEHRRVVERRARVGAVGDRVVAHAQREVGHAVRLVESAPRLQVDRAADRVGVHVRRENLGHLDAGQLGCRNDVQLDHAVRTVRVRDLLAVDRDVRHRRRRTAHGDEAAFAVVPLNGDAADALQDFRRVQVGEALDLLFRQNRLDVDGLLLLVQRLALPEADRLDDDLLGELVAGVELDRQGDGLPGRDRDAGLEVLEADVVHVERVVAGGHAVEPVAAVAARQGAVGGVSKRHLRARKQGAGFLLGDRALDGRASLGQGGAGAEQRRQRGEAGALRGVRELLSHGAVSPSEMF